MRQPSGLIGLALTASVLLAGCGAQPTVSTAPPTTPITTSTPATTTAPAQSTSTKATAGAIVDTKTDATAGSFLVGSNGQALYTIGTDPKSCDSGCVGAWPVYTSTDTSVSLPTDVTIITRADGTKQFAYKGLPLYFFSGDSATGSVSGNGLSGFTVAKP